jgi:orotate phosphoribosyltransferase
MASIQTREDQIQKDIVRLLPIRRGHFRLESGHHGDLWLDLELLCLDPQPVRRFASEIAARLARYDPEILCGPLVEGAFVALMAASELGLPFCYSERQEPVCTESHAGQPADALYPVEYRIPRALRAKVRGKRVAIVNDVINAGSAVRGTMAGLADCGAEPVVIATLLVLGSWASEYAKAQNLTLETLATLPNTIWAPADCPLCKQSIPLDAA